MSTQTLPSRAGSRPRPRTHRSSISFPDPVYRRGIQVVEEDGFSSFSAYLEHLVRIDIAARSGRIVPAVNSRS